MEKLPFCVTSFFFRINRLLIVNTSSNNQRKFLEIWIPTICLSLCLSAGPCCTLTQILTHPRGDRKFGVSSLRIFWVSVSQMRKHTHTHTPTSASLKPFPEMYYFVQLSTHHHLQSAQPLPPFELHYLFSSRPLSLPSFSPTSLALPLIHSGLCCWAVMYRSTYLFAFFTANSLLLSLPASRCVGNKAAARVLFPVLKTWVSEPR